MKGYCKVTYIMHSGVLVETENSYLLFDYWKGEIPELNPRKSLYVFVSHMHHDHFSKEIFKLENKSIDTRYILSFDIRTGCSDWKTAETVLFMEPEETKVTGQARVRTLRSTDEGVAFLVKIDGMTIYHAGDLHWWYWPGESEEDNTVRRQNEYMNEIEKLSEEEIDLSFVVLDPRQTYAGGYGMDRFLASVATRYLFPIHFWEDYQYIRDYREKTAERFPAVSFADITQPGQSFVLDVSSDSR